jgi:hypothetical protein
MKSRVFATTALNRRDPIVLGTVSLINGSKQKRVKFPDFEIRFAAVPRDRRNANANREDQAQRTQ